MTATERKWAERVGDWKASGGLAEDYARGRGFEASTLRWWSSRLRRSAGDGGKTSTAPAGAVRLVRVIRRERDAAPPSVTIRVGAAHVEVRRGFDGGLLREVIEALGGER